MNEKKTENNRCPNMNDHLQHQQGLRAKKARDQDINSAEDAINYLALQVQTKYRKGRRHVEAKVVFLLKQIDGLTLEPDGLAPDPDRHRKLQRKRLEEIFLPLIEQAFDSTHLIGETSIQVHGKGCTIKADYQVKTPKQFRQ